jgi:hypothetical protein
MGIQTAATARKQLPVVFLYRSTVIFQIHLNKPAVQHKCNKSHIVNWFITRWLLLSKAANDDGLALGLITASQSPKYKKLRVEKERK